MLETLQYATAVSIKKKSETNNTTLSKLWLKIKFETDFVRSTLEDHYRGNWVTVGFVPDKQLCGHLPESVQKGDSV